MTTMLGLLCCAPDIEPVSLGTISLPYAPLSRLANRTLICCDASEKRQ